MDVWQWIKEHEMELAWLGGFGLFFFLGSLITMPLLIIGMAEDFFVRAEKAFPRTLFRQILHILKNVVGYGLIAAGVLMLILPGQGLLTIAVGVSLIDFPGKRRLEIRLVRIRQVATSIAWIRGVAGRPPLQIPGSS
jgi:hypothetical protein